MQTQGARSLDQRPENITKKTAWLLVALCLLIFLKNAWLSDDAYIIFRSIEQWAAGNGPRWNSFERVQTYTSPLWFFLLCGLRYFSENLYFLTIGLSLFCFVLTIIFSFKSISNESLFALFLAGLIASPSFYDYTTSGLENPLGYCAISLYLYAVHQIRHTINLKALKIILFVSGLTPLIRHDLALLIWPTTALIIFSIRRKIDWAWITKWGLIALFPFMAWCVFSLVYYGLLFPNTAYAKLNTGIHRPYFLQQGIYYLIVSGRDDPIGSVIAFLGITLAFWRGHRFRHLTAGPIIHVFYVIYIGGDFMRGRFLSYDVLWLCTLCVWCCPRPALSAKGQLGVAFICLAAIVAPPKSPLMASPFGPAIKQFFTLYTGHDYHGIEDERLGFMREHGLISVLIRPLPFRFEKCPFHGPCIDFSQMKNCPRKSTDPKYTSIERMIGVLGYIVGPYCKIIDQLALSDPLLAQLPMPDGIVPQVPGHNPRRIPAGYFESVTTGKNLIEDPKIHALYDKIRLITQSKNLFSAERWRAIWEINTGSLRKYATSNYR